MRSELYAGQDEEDGRLGQAQAHDDGLGELVAGPTLILGH